MQLSRLFFCLALVAAPIAFVGTTWLYLYPLFDKTCSFPAPPGSTAPFRLLALGDPQLEGDSSLPKAGAPIFRSFDALTDRLREAETLTHGCRLVLDGFLGIPKDLVRAAEGYIRKPIDIWGNDWYLGHIVRTLRWWTQPSHVAVLGDLLGSQWVSDAEFERRGRRYWDIVLGGMEKVPQDLMKKGEEGDQRRWGGAVEPLGANPAWANRVINIAGNHDIGYAGDIDDKRIARFEDMFGQVNWDVVFTLPSSSDSSETETEPNDANDAPALRLVILNSMNLDTPAYATDLQHDTYDFINHVITSSRSVNDKTHATILLTHIPLHKKSGVCADDPLFTFFEGGGIKEQNMLSQHGSTMVLESIFGLSSNPYADGQGFGRRGFIINGHDHVGCDVLHYTSQVGVASQCPENVEEHEIHLPPAIMNSSAVEPNGEMLEEAITSNDTLANLELDTQAPEDPQWQVQRYPHLPYAATEDGACIAVDHVPRVREVTLRSMMGDFAGYAGFFSAWFDPSIGDKGEWKMEFSTCGLGIQHWWWGVHITDLILVVALVAGALAWVLENRDRPRNANGVQHGEDLKRHPVEKPLGKQSRSEVPVAGKLPVQDGEGVRYHT